MSIRLLLKALFRRKLVTLLVLLQLAITLALWVNSSLLAYGNYQILNTPTGFNLEQQLVVTLKPTERALQNGSALQELITRQLAAIKALPGVKAATYNNQRGLLQGGSNGNIFVRDHYDTTNQSMVAMHFTSPELADVWQLQVLEGRWLTEDDQNQDHVVLTQSVAKALQPQGSVIGLDTSWGQVVGVVNDVLSQRYASQPTFAGFFNRPLTMSEYFYVLEVLTEPGQTARVQQQLSEVLRGVEVNIDVLSVQTYQQAQHDLYQMEIGMTTLLLVLSALMLTVALISAYSHAHFHALQLRHEIGIKRALGASRRAILLEVLAESWLTTALGTGFGVVACFVLNHALASWLTLPVLSWWLPLVAIAMLLICITLATWYPAITATRISPALATRL